MAVYDRIVLSCEHAGHRVPAEYGHLFADRPEVLRTHRGYDIGIRPVAEVLAERLACPIVRFDLSRLLVEPNRSRGLFSEFSRVLPGSDRQALVERYHRPYRRSVLEMVEAPIRAGHTVLHLSMHSFTPELDGRRRNADVGLLYDPARTAEKAVALNLQDRLASDLALRVRRNYPYRGTSDGMTAWLRRRFPPRAYLGLEIEINQALLQSGARAFRNTLCQALCRVLGP